MTDLVSACKQLIGLVFVNAIAFYFDGQWIPVAVAVDLLVLGYDLKSLKS